jgi:hypothetical protein
MPTGEQLKQKFDDEYNRLQKLVAANPQKGILVSMAIGAAVLRVLEWIL